MKTKRIHIYIGTIVILILMGVMITGSGLFMEAGNLESPSNVWGALSKTDSNIFAFLRELLDIKETTPLLNNQTLLTNTIVAVSGLFFLAAIVPIMMIWGTVIYVKREKED